MCSPPGGIVRSDSSHRLQSFEEFGQLNEHVLHSLRNGLPSRDNLTSSDVLVSQPPMSLVTSPHLSQEHLSQAESGCDSRWLHVVVILRVNQGREIGPIPGRQAHTPECYTVVCFLAIRMLSWPQTVSISVNTQSE
jgi:hypothetical protein